MNVRPTRRVARDLSRMLKAGYEIEEMDALIDLLTTGKALPGGYQEHDLVETWAGYTECHLSGDWLVIYRRRPHRNEIVLHRTGTHLDLF